MSDFQGAPGFIVIHRNKRKPAVLIDNQLLVILQGNSLVIRSLSGKKYSIDRFERVVKNARLDDDTEET